MIASVTPKVAGGSGVSGVLAHTPTPLHTIGYAVATLASIHNIEASCLPQLQKKRKPFRISSIVGATCGLLTKIEQDVSSCVPLLSVLDLINVELFPVSSIFGGWNGYSMVLAFK